MKKAYFYEMAIGRVGIAEEYGAITHVFFGNTVKPGAYEMEETPGIKRASAQMAEYFAGARKAFDLPLAPEGTDFERAVWAALQTIPFGQTRTYGQIAAQINRLRQAVPLAAPMAATPFPC